MKSEFSCIMAWNKYYNTGDIPLGVAHVLFSHTLLRNNKVHVNNMVCT